MKKFYCFIIALVMTVFMASAQTVEHAGLFENTYVTLVGGGVTTGQFNQVPTPFFWDGAKGMANGVRPFAGLEFGKYVTPVVGFSVEGLAFYNTTTSFTFIDESAVLANGKLNFSNWFGGYKGQPRRVEVVGVLGMGWGHDYVGNGQTWTSYLSEDLEPVVGNDPYNTNGIIFTDKDYVVYNAGAELNVNLGKARAWQINVRPGVMWFNKHTKTQYQSLPRFMNDARAYAQVGVTYKFGSKKKGGAHNFVLCPYSVTQADYDALQKKYDELAARGPVTKEVVKEVVKTEKVTEVKEVPTYFGKTYITFSIGSAALTSVERAKLAEFAKNINEDNIVYIVGSADSKTGTETRNFALAQRRAEVVRNVLMNDFGVKNEIKISTELDVTEAVETSRAAVLTLEAVDVD